MQGLNDLKNQLNTAKSIMVVTADNPNLDCVASSLALYLALKNAGKNVIVASNTEPIVRDSHLVSLDKVKTEIGNTNLVISFDYEEDSVEKVSYNVEDGKFNLVIQPKTGFTPFDSDKFSFSHTGANADLVIVVGASSIAGTGNILSREQELLNTATIANISNRPGRFGKINLIDPKSSLAELITAVIHELGLKLTLDAANNLMQGIEDATNGLSSPDMTADTFEALAVLYRTGARRSIRKSAAPNLSRPVISQKPTQAKRLQPQSSKPTFSPNQNKQTNDQKTSPDWMGPKIYKGSTRV